VAIAKLRVVVAGMTTTTLSSTPANRFFERSLTAFVGIETIMGSAALAASVTETGVAPISAAKTVRVSGPLELAINTSWPSFASLLASPRPRAPAPMTPILIAPLPAWRAWPARQRGSSFAHPNRGHGSGSQARTDRDGQAARGCRRRPLDSRSVQVRRHVVDGVRHRGADRHPAGYLGPGMKW
jgi:hypothetical protein